MVVLVVMMSAEEQYHAADQHKTRQNGFAPMAQHMLYTIRLSAHHKRNTEQYICRQFAENEHQTVRQNEPFVIDFLVDITDGGDACHQRTRVKYGKKT